MENTGYSALEKAKILYEDSLSDMRELTARIEVVGQQLVDASSALAKRETGANPQAANDIRTIVGLLEAQQQRLDKFTSEARSFLAAGAKNTGVLHSINESFLMGQIKVITGAVESIKSFQAPIVKETAQALCEPLVEKMKGHVVELAAMERAAMRLLTETKELQARASGVKMYTLIAAFVALSLSFSAGYFLR
jgi:hypothetical protein